MTGLSLKEISEAMRDIDICMLTTKTASGQLDSRPMSNNREVDYDGDSYFFADGDCSAAREIETAPEVSLGYVHQPTLGRSLYIAATGRAELIRDKAEMQKHWVKDLEIWFKDGIDTPGLVLIHVRAAKLKYWKGEQQGEIAIKAA